MPPGAHPVVAANFALTFDGKISTRRLTPSDFSSKRDKRHLLEIRAGGDAVLVGRGTLEKENMSMGLPAADLRAMRRRQKKTEAPLRVIISNSGRLNPTLQLFQKTSASVIIYSTTKMPEQTRRALAPHAQLHLHETRTVDLPKMLAHLRQTYRVRRLICEGGPTLLRTLLVEDLVDEINITFCPRIFGGENAPTLTGIPSEFLPRTLTACLAKMEMVGEECFVRYRLMRRAHASATNVST